MTSQAEAERAVYELLENGPMSAERSTFFADTLASLVAARLVRRTHDGGHELVRPRSVVPREDTDTFALLTVELPADCVAMLDALAPTRDEAVMVALRPYLGSGVWRKRPA